jgi:potassium-transporting ATPase KdpC subunit
MNLKKQIFPAIAATFVFTIIVGVVYPFVITLASQLLFKDKAHGSLIYRDGKVIGSSLIGQPFGSDGYFHSRPSAAGDGYDGMASGGTNLGPTSKKLMEETIKPEVIQARKYNSSDVPVDFVTSSASGLDPDITPAAAEFQVKRVAKARGMEASEVRNLILQHTKSRQFGFLGEPRVNVVELNLALDATTPMPNKE